MHEFVCVIYCVYNYIKRKLETNQRQAFLHLNKQKNHNPYNGLHDVI